MRPSLRPRLRAASLALLLALLARPAAAQVPVPTGIVSPLFKCPAAADIVAGKLTSFQSFCLAEFTVCMSSPEMVAPASGATTIYTALTARNMQCTFCYADAWACYSDCPKPGFPVGFLTACNALCAPDLNYVCSGSAAPVLARAA